MMDREFIKELRLDGELFSQVRDDFNFVLQRLLGNMQEKGADSGALTLKLEIDFDTDRIPNFDPNIDGETREINKPKFKHKITSTVQIKDEKGGNMDTEMELVMDEETGCYVLQPVANTSQRTIFDADYVNVSPEKAEHVDGEIVDPDEYLEGNALPGRKVAGLLGMNPPEDEAGEESSESPQTGETPDDEDYYAEDGEEAPLDGNDVLFGDSDGEDDPDNPVDDGFSYEDPEEE